jgi:hypothetical protein
MAQIPGAEAFVRTGRHYFLNRAGAARGARSVSEWIA